MDILFYVLALFATVGALIVLFIAHPLYAVLGLLITMLAIAGLFAMLSASFLFVVQIIVYAGAIMTLLLFILMFLNLDEENLIKEPYKIPFIIVGAVIIFPITLLMGIELFKMPLVEVTLLESSFGDIAPLGRQLFKNWVLAFELISILLLVALIGAIVLAKRKVDRQQENKQKEAKQ